MTGRDEVHQRKHLYLYRPEGLGVNIPSPNTYVHGNPIPVSMDISPAGLAQRPLRDRPSLAISSHCSISLGRGNVGKSGIARLEGALGRLLNHKIGHGLANLERNVMLTSQLE